MHQDNVIITSGTVKISNPPKFTWTFLVSILDCDLVVNEGQIVVMSDEAFSIINVSSFITSEWACTQICNKSGRRMKVGSTM